MKFLSFKYNDVSSLGILHQNKSKIIDIHLSSKGELPNNMLDYLNDFDKNNSKLNNIILNNEQIIINIDNVELIAPLPNPVSFRDAYAFRQHVEAGRKNRGLEMIPEYDNFPVFYFSNHNSICGPGLVKVQKNHLEQLDFEFEIAAVISKKGKNIKKEDACKYIAGFTIMNDWSARFIQLKEMKLNLGPAKGKDFATSIGPYLVTVDELKNNQILNQDGIRYNLEMKGYINDNLVSTDNFKNMTWTFSQIIEQISNGVNIYPGDLIGSGTCATGCLLENNLSKNDKTWLTEGDVVKLEVECLGSLINKISL